MGSRVVLLGKGVLVLGLICFQWLARAGDSLIVHIEGGTPRAYVQLSRYAGNDRPVVDHIRVIDSNKVRYEFAEDAPRAMYHLDMGKPPRSDRNAPPRARPAYFDLFYNGEGSVELRTSYRFPIDSMEVLRSEENARYYDYLRKKRKFDDKLKVINKHLVEHADRDSFYANMAEQLARFQKKKRAMIRSHIEAVPGSLSALVMRTQMTPILPARKTKAGQRDAIMEHFFKVSDFEDPRILKTNALNEKILEFMRVIRRSTPQKERNKIYKKGVDILLAEAYWGNDRVYSFVIDYLVEGFRQLQREELLVYLHDRYLEQACEQERFGEDTKAELRAEARTAIGEKAPSFELENGNGNLLSLENPSTDYLVLVFWASWCTHCKRSMPRVKEAYEEFAGEGLGLISYSLDSSKSAWRSFLKKGNYYYQKRDTSRVTKHWYNCRGDAGWESELPRLYGVNATPSFFVLDDRRRIVAKPASVIELRETLEDRLGGEGEGASPAD